MAARIPDLAQTQRRYNDRSSQEEAQETAPASSRPRTRSQSSDDSQTVVLSHKDAKQSHSPSQSSRVDEEVTADDTLQCWICLMDEPVADREAGNWRSPCSCNLTAHEECLFMWIAEKKEDVVKCPACQTKIEISQPRDYIITFANQVRKIADYSALPAGICSIVGITYSGLLVYGANAVTLVFGATEATEIFTRALAHRSNPRHWNAGLPILVPLPFVPHFDMDWTMMLGLPLIAPTLILSRFKIGDKILSAIPIMYFLLEIATRPSSEILQWPPSPGLTLAVVPWVRTFYTETYKHFFQDMVRNWDQAVQRQPREGETAEQIAAEAANARNADIHQLEVGIEIVPDDDEEMMNLLEGGNRPPRNARQQGGLPGIADPAANVAGGAAGQGQNADPAGVREDVINQRVDAWERRLNITTDGIASSILGALFFPAISYMMGSIIKHTFPMKWVKRPQALNWLGPKKLSWSEGLLQSQFGRSIVGGCMFIVLKDAVVLYYKWKRAKDYGRRKILDYQGKKNDGRS